jgi:hypothetical protein
MSERAKVSVLIVLGALLAAVVFYTYIGGTSITVGAGSAASDSYQAMDIENPALHLDRIERLRKLEYKPTGRDIFNSVLPQAPVKVAPKTVPAPTGPQEPAPPPALVVPFKYYGFSDDVVTKKRRGFFTNGEEVFIVGEGEIVQGKYRIITISTTWTDVEEVSTGRHTRLNMEGQGTSPQGESPQR